MKRTLTGLTIFIVLFGFICLTDISQFFFDFLLMVALVFSVYEMYKLGVSKDFRPAVIPVAIMLFAMYPMIYFFHSFGYTASAGIGFLLIFCFYIFDQRMEFKDFMYSVFMAIYPILLFSLSFNLIHYPFGETRTGMLPFLIALGSAFCADTFAFYFGSLIKGPKIFPKISPKKTYAGCIAALFGGAAGAMIVYFLFEFLKLPINAPLRFTETLSHPILFYTFTGAAIAVISILGDLGASRIKRSLGIKDFSHALGSHGGVVDRLDSTFFSLVFMSILMYFLV